MKIVCRFIVALFCAFCMGLPVVAEVSETLYSTLRQGVNIRGLSMGSALTGSPEGPVALFYNPAGLAAPGAMYMYHDMDHKKAKYTKFHSHMFYNSPFGFANWSKKSLNGDRAEVTALGYGRRNKNGISWGVTYKAINESNATLSQKGWSSDVGVLMNMNKNISLGVTAQDIIGKNIEGLSPSLRTGVSFFNRQRSLMFNSDLVLNNRSGKKKEVSVHYGLEYFLTDGFFVRGGWFDKHYTAGLSFEFPIVGIDYGLMVPVDREQETLYMFGIKLGKGPKKQAVRRKYALFKHKSYAYFSLGGNLVDGQSEVSLLGGQRIGTNDLVTLIHEATKDEDCRGFVVRLGKLRSSLGTLAAVQELKQELQKARDKGKKVIVYIEHWAMLPEYYLATVADTVIMPELGTLSHLGLKIEVTKTIRFLEKFGFEEEIISTGSHKDAFQGSQKLSDSDRMLIEEILHDLYGQVVADIKADRNLDWDKVSHVFDGRLVSATEAKELGLIDKLGYWDETVNVIKEDFEKDDISFSTTASLENISEFVASPTQSTILSPFNKIAVIEVDGPIHMGANTSDMLFGGKSTGADYFDKMVDIIKKDMFIKGVIIRVNSPGGSLLASDRIYQSIEKLKEKGIPVYTSMGVMAASGGYFVAMNSDQVYANKSTLTGSVGVISIYRNKKKFNDILGFDVEQFKTGKYMGMFSSNQSLTKEEKAMLANYQKEKYDYFIGKLAENRELSDKEVKDVSQGQLFTGEKAKELKLVDHVGGFYDAVDGLAKEAKISGEPEIVYYRPQPKRTLNLFDGSFFRRLIGL